MTTRKEITAIAHARRREVLSLLLDRGVMKQTEIAEAMGLTAKQVNDLTKSMRAEGLVDNSGLLGLTAKGLMVAVGAMDLRPTEAKNASSRHIRPLVVARMMQLWDDGFMISEIAEALESSSRRIADALKRELGVKTLPVRSPGSFASAKVYVGEGRSARVQYRRRKPAPT